MPASSGGPQRGDTVEVSITGTVVGGVARWSFDRRDITRGTLAPD